MDIKRVFPDGTQIVIFDHDDGTREVRLEADGKDLSCTFIFPYLMRIGEAVVRMDGIGGVATGEEYRYRGYSRRVMEAAVELMRGGDAALATLYGIQDFYPKFGFATCGPEYTVILPPDDRDASVAALPEGWAFRPFAPEDLPAVMDIYDANTRRATGAIVRHAVADEASLVNANAAALKVSGRAWETLPQLAAGPDNDACRVLLDASGELVAYAWIGRSGWWVQSRERHAPESFHLGEVMAKDPVAADAVITAARMWASEAAGDTRQIEFVTPPESPVAHAAAYQGGIFVGRHTREGEFMARVLDLGRFFQQMQPELSARLRTSRVGFEGTLVVRTDEGEASIAIGPDGVSLGSHGDR